MSAEKSLSCSRLHTREIEVPSCTSNGAACRRIYHFYLPRTLCHGGSRRLGRHDPEFGHDEGAAHSTGEDGPPEEEGEIPTAGRLRPREYFGGHYYRVGTLPLVFCLHGFGSDSRSMMNFVPHAERFHFVLVLPEGVEKSFNAGECCGFALENGIDDVGFLSRIQSDMTSEFDFLQPMFSYGIGHNNGAFLLTHALESRPHMFRSIVPISGYTHRVDLIRAKLGAGSGGIGMMVHHSLNDAYVRPSGCCGDPNLPKCNAAGVQSDYCMSVLQMFNLWAGQINMCGNANTGDNISADSDLIVGGNGNHKYLLSYQNQSMHAVFSLMTDSGALEKRNTLFISDVPMSVSYIAPNNTAACLTGSSQSCVANSTLCLYANEGDFQQDFGREFPEPMFEEALRFIAREACSVNDGMLEVIPRHGGRKPRILCACLVSSGLGGPLAEFYGGAYCFDSLNEDGTYKVLPTHHANAAKTTSLASNSAEFLNAEAADNPDSIKPTITALTAPNLGGHGFSAPSALETTATLSSEQSGSIEEEIQTLTTPLNSHANAMSSVAVVGSAVGEKEKFVPPASIANVAPSLATTETIEKGDTPLALPTSEGTTTISSSEVIESAMERDETSTQSSGAMGMSSQVVRPTKDQNGPAPDLSQTHNTTLFENPKLESPKLQKQTADMSNSLTNGKSHEWILILMIIFIILVLALSGRRRKLRHRPANRRFQSEEDDIIFDRGMEEYSQSGRLPYRDYFQKGNSADNSSATYQDNGRYTDAHDNKDDDHCPPWRRRQRRETELVNRNHAGVTLDEDFGWGVRSSQPDRYAPSPEEDMRGRGIDFSFRHRGADTGNDSRSSNLGTVARPMLRLGSGDRSLLQHYREIHQGRKRPDPDGIESGMHNLEQEVSQSSSCCDTSDRSVDDDLDKMGTDWIQSRDHNLKLLDALEDELKKIEAEIL